MCWFFKKKKQKKEEQIFKTKQTDLKPEEKITEKEKVILEKKSEESNVKEEQSKAIPKEKEPVKSSGKTRNAPKKKVEEAKVKVSTKYSGKYEIYKEAGYYKYRLKASNGEILAVSLPYTTDKGALSGINTFKKNVETGIFEIYTDKSNFSQYHLYTANKSRVIMVGEFYTSSKLAESAVESVKNFYKTNRIETLAKIPEDEIKEEVVKMEKITDYSVGKYEIYKEDNSFFIRLKANNAQVLFVSQGYSSKASAKQGLITIKTAISDKRFTVAKDKQNRYQFNLYSATNQLILTGETYPQKSSCISAITSVRKFADKSKIVEL